MTEVAQPCTQCALYSSPSRPENMISIVSHCSDALPFLPNIVAHSTMTSAILVASFLQRQTQRVHQLTRSLLTSRSAFAKLRNVFQAHHGIWDWNDDTTRPFLTTLATVYRYKMRPSLGNNDDKALCLEKCLSVGSLPRTRNA